jgi:hypothetical protein
MSVQLTRQGFRFWCDERSRQPLLDYYTNAAPQGWSQASTQFEIALVSRGALVDVTNLSSVRLDGVAYNNRDGTRLFSQTLPGSSLNNALTLDTWEDGTQQHALFVFDQAAMNILPSGAETLQVWLMITALTLAGEQLVCGAGTMTFNDDGAFTSAGSPPANPGAAISLGPGSNPLLTAMGRRRWVAASTFRRRSRHFILTSRPEPTFTRTAATEYLSGTVYRRSARGLTSTRTGLTPLTWAR